MVKKRGLNKAARRLSAVGTARRKVEYVLRLYVAGMNPRSIGAIRNITAICEQHLLGRYQLEVVDIYQQPALAKGEQILAVPTLVKKLPVPLRRFIGTLQDRESILVGLDLAPVK